MSESKYFVGLVSRDPLVLRFFWFNQDMQEIKLASDLLGSEPAIFLVSNGWSLIGRYRQGTLLPLIERLKHDLGERPHHRLLLLGNDEAESQLCNAMGVQSLCSSHNIWLDSDVFKITGAQKKYDAVYNSQFIRHKRCELVEKVSNICFISASGDAEYIAEIWKAVSHAKFANGSPLENPRRLPPREVNEIYNQSAVGLCLSWMEGGMLSAGEYLLAGLPVVSTHNIGGRDVLFDDYNSIAVPADSQSVANAAADLAKLRRDPYRIRANALSRMWRMRADLCAKVFEMMGDDWDARQRFDAERIFLDLRATLPVGSPSKEEMAGILETNRGQT
ncbi:MAG: glycosyltransferase family 1 protein [Bradyrhizobium sp.]|nr:MAG: glycosyltransferase family 1 protein [Bradyrhizobium sp.]